MEIIISGRHLGITDEMKQHAEKRLTVLAGEYPKLSKARVVMELERNWHLVEIHVTGKNLSLEAKARTDNMYVSIDEAVEKVEKQLRKYLDRVHEHRVPAEREEAEATDSGDTETEIETEDEKA